jgi:hypothetical protein
LAVVVVLRIPIGVSAMMCGCCERRVYGRREGGREEGITV